MFFGREDLMEQLEALCGKGVSSLVTCRGRRRVGKSTLIKEFARRLKCNFIRIEGLRPDKDKNNDSELEAFSRQLAKQTPFEKRRLEDWSDAFSELGRNIPRSRTVVLLDEVSWLAYYDETFADYLKIAWDAELKNHDRLILVVCGSVSTWVRENIIDNGAFFGRRSLDMVVPELPLCECAKFWGRSAKRIATREILDVLSVTGGVPRYLEEINPRLSAADNVRNLCFKPKSVLREDFDEMFRDVITSKSSFTSKVLRCMADGPKSCSEIQSALGDEKGGHTTRAVRALEESGFIAPECRINPENGRPLRLVRYRLKDNYTRFYLKFIEPHKEAIDDGSFAFVSLSEFEGCDSVMGLAFENLVVNNYRDLIPYLHLDGALITSAGPYRKIGKGRRKGCQVDLLIQTRRSLHFVEIKRKNEIGREVFAQVDAQISALKRQECVSAKTALVYDGELSPVAKADGYFDAIIPFRRLLGL